jgi:hypothetical protein
MLGHVQTLVEAVGIWEQSPPSEFNDFSALIPVGERLRRAANLLQDVPVEAARALTSYDSFLPRMPKALARRLARELDKVLSEVGQLADPTGKGGLPQDGETALQGLDEILSLVAAAGRAGHLGPVEVGALGETARTAVAKLAPRLPNLWQFAEDTELAYGPDPDYPGLFSFWEELARLAQSRCDMEAALAAAYMDPARRQALFEKAKAILCPEPKESLAERLARWVEECARGLSEPLMLAPVPASAAGFAAHPGWARSRAGVEPPSSGFARMSSEVPGPHVEAPPRVRVLADVPGLISILQNGEALVIVLPEAASPVSVRVSAGGKSVRLRRTVERNRIEIPTAGIAKTAHIHVRFRLDGKSVELPPVGMSRGEGNRERKRRTK